LGESDEDFVRLLGADQFISRRQKLKKNVGNVDLVIDLVRGETRRQSFDVIKPGGRLITAPAPIDDDEIELAKARRIKIAFVEYVPTSDLLRQIAKLLDAGKLKTNVADIVPLSKTRHAHELLQQHKAKRGKVVLRVA
jgi:NADPH:quinone reductase-like Zn-dependent oxidoreductase